MYLGLLDDRLFSSPEQLARGVAQVRQAMEARLQAVQAPYATPSRPGAVSPLDIYSRGGGVDYRKTGAHQIDLSGGGGGVRRTDPETGETREWNGQQWVPVGR